MVDKNPSKTLKRMRTLYWKTIKMLSQKQAKRRNVAEYTYLLSQIIFSLVLIHLLQLNIVCNKIEALKSTSHSKKNSRRSVRRLKSWFTWRKNVNLRFELAFSGKTFFLILWSDILRDLGVLEHHFGLHFHLLQLELWFSWNRSSIESIHFNLMLLP